MRGLIEDISNRQSSIINRQSDRPTAAIVFFFSIGIASSLVCRQYSFAGLFAGDAVLILAAWLAFLRDRVFLSLAIGLAAISMGGLLMALAQRDGFSNLDIRSHISRRAFPVGEPVSFEGCVVKESELRGDESAATVELSAFLQKDHWVLCKGKGILKMVEPAPTSPSGPGFNLLRGDKIRGWATWNAPRNYENPGSADSAGQLSRRGVFLIGRIKSLRLVETIPGGCGDPWTGVANYVGTRVRKSLAPIREWRKGQPAAILASLLIGDYSGLNNATRETFQNSGTFHVLVVSGLHVAWIAGLLLKMCALFSVPERIRYLAAFFVILLYTCVIGFQASITRCLWMFLLYLIGRVIFRRADTLNILLGSALILLLAQPYWLIEPGFQLSFLSVLAIAATGAPAINTYLNPVWDPLRRAGKSDYLFLQPGRWYRYGRRIRVSCELLVEEMTDRLPLRMSRILLMVFRGIAAGGLLVTTMVVISVAVQIWLDPILACHFNRISWISPISNLVVVPLFSVVLSVGIIAAVAANISLFGPALIRLAGSLASLLLSCAVRTTEMKGAWQRCPTPSAAWVLAGVLLLFFWSSFGWRRFWAPCSAIAVMMGCLSYGSVPVVGEAISEFRCLFFNSKEGTWRRNASILSFTFLDVGEGDCTVIRFPDMRVWVLDAGGLRQPHSQEDSAYGFDIGEAVVSRYLWHAWINRIDRLILSHPDIDHAGGIPAVMQNFRNGRFDYSQSGPDAIISAILNIAQQRQIAALRPHRGNEETIGPVKIRVLHPPANSPFNSTNENSLVLELSFKSFSALLTGDLEKSGENEFISQPGISRCCLLKVAHHGSRWGTSNSFLDRIQPHWAVISVGRNNPFGHPSQETLSRLRQHGVHSLLTVDEGAVTFETDGDSYVLRSYVNGILDRGIFNENH
jgi:competence protein ComEC